MPVEQAPNPWVIVPRPNLRARLRLFCFPYGGGGASAFYPWTRMIPAEIELCLVQPPGRESRFREEPYRNMLALVNRLADVLAPWLDVPFTFFGHSNGAIMSFELARRLRRDGRPMPLHLFLSGRQAAHIPNRHPPIHTLAEPAFSEQLRRLGGTPEEILQDTEMMDLVRPLLRADFSLTETYSYTTEPPLGIPISAYGSVDDPDVTVEDVHAWREHTSAAFHARIFPGGHFFLNTERTVVLEVLSRELTQVIADGVHT